MWTWLKRQESPETLLKEALGDSELPTFPNLVLETLALLRSPESALCDIADQVALDPQVSVKLLSISNSAAVALQHEVRSIQHAVSLLGRARVESIVMGLAVSGCLNKTAFQGLSSRDFWSMAAERAVLARTLAKRIHPASQDESFTAGLLQDLAIPLIAEVKGTTYQDLILQWWNDGGNLSEMEMQEFGWEHGQIAGCLCADWKLPRALCDAIAGHHQLDGGENEVPRAVQLVAQVGVGRDGTEYEELIELLRVDYNFEPDDTTAMLESVKEHAQELAQLFG